MKLYRSAFHKVLLKMPGFLEKIVAAILLIAVVYGGIGLVKDALAFSVSDFTVYLEDVLGSAFSVIIIIEFVRMLVKHSMNTIIEVLIFAIARSLVVGHENALHILLRILSIALLLLCRKYLFKDFDFEEE